MRSLLLFSSLLLAWAPARAADRLAAAPSPVDPIREAPLRAIAGPVLPGAAAAVPSLTVAPLELPVLPAAPAALGAAPSAPAAALPAAQAAAPRPDENPGAAEVRQNALFDGLKTFGAKNGTEIANKGTVLTDVDRALGRAKPPALEYIFVRPLAMVKVGKLGLGTNPYGHAVVRYTMPGGEQKAMNIVGKPGRQMVNFMKPEDYLYGTNTFDSGSEQGGVYNRAMVGLRFEELPDGVILKLDRYYNKLLERNKKGDAGFDLALPDLRNFLAWLIPGHQAERGNCARWVSMGLKAAGLLRGAILWPKGIFVKLYERYKRAAPDNVHVVSYRRPHHAVHTYGADVDAHGLVAPFRWLKDRKYWDLEKFADAIVEVPAGSMTAEVRRTK